MARDITSARTLKETISLVMHHIGRVFEPANWSLLLKDQTSGDLHFILVKGVASDLIQGRVLPKGTGIAGWVSESAQQLIVEDVSKDSRFHHEIDAISGFKTHSIIAVPLVTRGKVYGVIELINKLDESLFSDLDLRILQAIADFTAVAFDRVYYMKKLRKMALVDVLTGLNNRRSFELSLDREIERTRRKGSVFSLLILDVDHFKSINDTYGHKSGDSVLKTVSRILLATTRKVDSCARLGGDEFAVLLPDTQEDEAAHLADRIQAEIKEAVRGGPISFTISIGARVVDIANPNDIMNEADREMYKAKNASHDEYFEDKSEYLSDSVSTEIEESERHDTRS